MTTTINVGIIGFSIYEEKKIEKIFEFSVSSERSYKLANLADIDPVDLLLVKKGDELITQQKQAYLDRYKNHHIPVITSGKDQPDEENSYYIGEILLPSRVLTVLDSIQISPELVDDVHSEVLEVSVETTPSPELETKDNVPSASEPSQREATEGGNTFHVLVVDDSSMMQKTIQLELQKASVPLAVDFADSGEQALEKISAKKYDFVFLDVMMPGIDGFETCAQIRKRDGMAKTPVIMLTAKTSALDEVKGLMAGCTTYLTKPFEHDEFHKMLERIMHWVKEFNEENKPLKVKKWQ